MIRPILILILTFNAVNGGYFRYLSNQMQSLLSTVSPFGYQFSSTNIPITSNAPALRLPVNGFGHETVAATYGVPNYSNPPPPPGSGSDPATQTCGLPPTFCPKARYRSLDGSCNNIQTPVWGTPQTPYGRLVQYNYADGVSAMPVSQTGRQLPNPREISLRLFPDKQLIDPVWNLNAQQWGQIITHDMSLTAGVAQTHKDLLTCCDDNGRLAPDAAFNPTCAPILIPPTDAIHAPQGTQCMNFVRTTTTRDRGCTAPNAPAEPLSTVTAYMDLSLVYGSSAQQGAAIRAYSGGRLATLVRSGREWPPQDPNITLTCESAVSVNEPCYLTGDIRVNQNPQLTILQIILLREHNRIADSLAKVNPYWDDETIYQEARRIHIAEIQHINYYEYLPIFLGFNNMVKNKLIYPGAKGYVNDYNPRVNPTVLDEHATAAFRHFHTLIRGYLQRNNTFGGDLRATDIQRGRDHGLGSYKATRAACNLPVPHTFHDMLDFISEQNVQILQTLYDTPEDVELVVAGSLERNVPSAQAGPTFLCILTEQFYRTRAGDRYFYENGADPEIAFTPSQLESIRHGSSMARLLCDNADHIQLMQPRAFEQISHNNKLVPCEELPTVDLSLWADSRNYYKKK
ncbi:Peroxidase [Papilio machaon]|uniref:Peroxidase n=1 Tax=Papilio machaon TaxID=76193 RepID=A0A194RTJ6_PAPMA|nr:Peroxidase [Papilio machaon]